MNREVVAIVGKTGWGKSWWGKLYTRKHNRLFVYDPVASFPHVEWCDGAALCDRFIDADADPPPHFRVGSYAADDAVVLGGASFIHANNTLVLEEVTTITPKGARLDPWLSRLTFLGRHRSCTVCVLAQRAASIPIDLRSQITRMVTFAQTEADDLSWLMPFFGRDVILSLPGLEKFFCYDCWNGNLSSYSIREQVKDAFGVTLDIAEQEVYNVG